MLLTLVQHDTWAVTCPEMPVRANDVSNDIKLDAKAAAGSIGKAKAAEMSIVFDKTAVSFLDKYRDADRVVLINMMAATYCSLLRDSKDLTDKEKDARWTVFNDKVFSLLTTPRAPVPTTTPTRPQPKQNPAKGVSYRPTKNFENEARLFLLYLIGPKQFSDLIETMKNKEVEADPQFAARTIQYFNGMKRDPAVYEEITRVWISAMRNHLTLDELHALNEAMSSPVMQEFFGSKYSAIYSDMYLPLQAVAAEWNRRSQKERDSEPRVTPR